MGNMPGTYIIRTDPSVPLMQHARGKVPIEYRDQTKKALDDMDLKGAITPVTKPTAWVSSLTYSGKPDGSLHICLDHKDFNKAIVWEHYKAPTLNEITQCWSGAKCFSKLDAKDGFWSIHLDGDSSYLTTFNTHHGRYRFLHMPFGLEMSQDVFQMWMDQATDSLPSIIAIHNDICVFGHTPKEHDEHLLCLMESAKTHGIVFNSAKCHIRQPQIAFYGAVFTGQGMWPQAAGNNSAQAYPCSFPKASADASVHEEIWLYHSL